MNNPNGLALSLPSAVSGQFSHVFPFSKCQIMTRDKRKVRGPTNLAVKYIRINLIRACIKNMILQLGVSQGTFYSLAGSLAASNSPLLSVFLLYIPTLQRSRRPQAYTSHWLFRNIFCCCWVNMMWISIWESLKMENGWAAAAAAPNKGPGVIKLF